MKINKFKIFFSLLTILSLVFVGCEDDNSADNTLSSYIGIEQYKYVGVAEDATVNVEGKVFATETSGSDRVFNLIVSDATTHDPMYYTVPATVTIPAGQKSGVFEVSITGTNLGTGKKLIVGLENVAGVNFATGNISVDDDGIATEVATKEMTFDINQVCYDNLVRLEIVTDQWGSETSWELYSDLDLTNPIASGGPYDDQSAAGEYLQDQMDLCLVDGAYTFVIYDVYSDGMDSGYGNGFYRLSKVDSATGGVLSVIAQNGVFGANEVVNFNLP